MGDYVEKGEVRHEWFYCDDGDGGFSRLGDYPCIMNHPEIDEDVAGLTASYLSMISFIRDKRSYYSVQ